MYKSLSFLFIWSFIALFSSSIEGQSSVFHRIQNNPDLQKFEEALIQTGLHTTFSTNQNVYTIFAPSNALWNTVPASILNNPTALRELILTHCVAGFYRSADFVNGFAVSTINNRTLTVKVDANGIIINGGKLKTLNIYGSNGVVHIIDKVIYPQATTITTVMSIIDNSPTHTVFATVIRNANLESRFTGTNKVTVFAPTNEAFFNLSQERLDKLVGTNVNYIENVVMYHVINAVIKQFDFINGGKLNTANGQQLSVTVNINGTYVNNVKVGFAGLQASNGLVYVIHKVLFPQPLPDFSIADYIEQSDNHTRLETYVNAAGLRPTLAAPGAMTFFAPTNAAFTALGTEVLQALTDDPQGLLKNVLRNHLVDDKKYTNDLLDDEITLAVNGFELTVDRVNNTIFVNDSRITISNIEVDNGLVHVIDAVLLEKEPFTIRDILATNEAVSNFNNYVVKSGLDVQLDTDGPFTVFAPTDLALSFLPIELREQLDGQLLLPVIEFIENHIVSPALTSSQLSNVLNLTAQNGFIINVRVENNDIFVNDSKIVIRDLQADNGVVHFIDAALYPVNKPSTIYEYVAQNENHTILETAIQKAELEFLYQSPGPLTLFAPTNAAFNNLSDEVLDELFTGPSTPLVDVLLRHTLNDDFTENELVIAVNVINANSEELKITVLNNEVYVNNAKLEITDIVLDNGIVHVIDAIIVQPAVKNTVFDVVVNSDIHTTLESAIEMAGLTDLYDLQSPITLFAPTDAAFNALPSSVLNEILADPNGKLRNLLFYHTNEESILSSDFVDGQVLRMLDGSDVLVTINSDGTFINEAKITIQDIEADNGIVHFMDAVIMPIIPRNTVYDLIVNDDNYSILEDAINAAGLDEFLIDETSITLFAPTNLAFNTLSPQVVSDLFADPNGALKNLLLYHIFDHLLATSSIFDGLEIVMENGDSAPFSERMGDLFINDARIINPDQPADNGLVHGLNAISMPAEIRVTVYDLLSVEEELNIFKSMVDSANMAEDLREADLITLFVPTNEAFELLPEGTLDALFNDPNGALREFLLKHQRNGYLLTSFMTDGMVITMSNGDEVVIDVRSDGVYLNESKIIIEDILADNGVLHVLDMIISDPIKGNTVYDVIAGSLSLNTLESAVDASGMKDALTNTQGITVFAPSDQAFESLPDGVLDDLLADPNGELRELIMFHTNNDEFKFINLIFKTSITMSNGKSVVITRANNEIYLNNAKIIGKDIQADNGVVHIIDAVITPSTTSLSELGEDHLIVYPNPVVDEIYIESYETITNPKTPYKVINAKGQLMGQGILNNGNTSIDVSQYATGEYFILLGDKSVRSEKFVKVK